MKDILKIVAILLFISCTTSCEYTDNESILLKEPTIVNVINGQLSKKSILIENDIIQEIGDYNELAKFGSKTVLDCTDKFIIPGLYDMHLHLVEQENMTGELDRLLKHGIVGIRDMGGIADTVAKAKQMTLDGSMQGPDIYMAGYTLDGAQSEDPFHYKVYDTTNMKMLAHNLKELGVDFFKVHNYFPLNKIIELNEAGEKLNLKIVGHIPVGIGPMELDSVGIKCVEHINSLLSGIVLKESNGVNNLEDAFAALDSSYVTKLSKYFRENDIAITPTLYGMNDMYSNLEGESSRAVGPRLMSLFYEIIMLMNQNDVLLLAGTDRGVINDDNIYELQDELAMMVKSGLTPLEALKTATINPAKFLEIDNEYGSVEINKKANLIILNSNPFSDISNTKDINMVLKNGEIFKGD